MSLAKAIEYVKYIQDNYQPLLKRIDEILYGKKELLKVQVVGNIVGQTKGSRHHYRFIPSDDPDKDNAYIVTDGKVPLDMKVSDFLLKEYSGYYHEPYLEFDKSFFGKHDDMVLRWCTEDMGDKIIETAIEEMIYDHFGEEISEGDYMIISRNCYDYICDSCLAGRITYDITAVISFFELEDVTLAQLIDQYNKRLDKRERKKKRLERMQKRQGIAGGLK